MKQVVDHASLHKTCTFVMACAAVAALVALQLYVLHFYRPSFSSDDAVVNTLAGSMWEQGRLFPRDWVNNNGDLMIPSGALIVAPLLAWLPNGFLAHAIAGVFATILIVGALVWFLRVLTMPWPAILLIASVLMAGFSWSFEILIFTQTTYAWWPAGFFIGAAIIVLYRRQTDASLRRTLGFSAALACVVFAISIANPSRVLVMMVAPLYVFDRFLVYGHRNADEINSSQSWFTILGLRDVLTVVGIGAGFVAAAAIYFLLARTGITQASYGAAALHWGGWSSVLRHAETFKGWFAFLGAPSDSILSGNLVSFGIGLFRWGIAIGLTWVGVSEIFRLPHQRDGVRRAMAAALLSAMLPITLIYLLFDPLAVDQSTMRYFIVPYCMALASAAFPIRTLLVSFPRVGIVGLMISSVLLVVIAVQLYVPAAISAQADFWSVRSSPTMKLAETLQREGLRWGYATWWNAGATTVQSDSSVQVLPVAIINNAIVPYPSMASKSWYRSDAWHGESFFALSQAETSDKKIEALLYLFEKPLRTIESTDYRILVFDRNISADFGKSTQGAMNFPLSRGDPSPRLLSAHLSTDPSAKTKILFVRIRNEAAFTISGIGRYPFSIGIKLLDSNGSVVAPEWAHSLLTTSIDPGQEKSFQVTLPNVEPGNWRIRVDLIQEHVAWLGDMGVPPIELTLDPDMIFGESLSLDWR